MNNLPSKAGQITVQIVYALPDYQHMMDVKVNANCKAIDAVIQSGILEKFVELKSQPLKLGNFSKIMAHDTVLDDGMRLEIYRPLIADPKEARRKRALLAKKKGGQD